MTTFPGSPNVLKGGFIVMDAEGRKVERMVPFQYNPDTLSRTLTARGAQAEAGDRLEALRLIGPPVEVLQLEVAFDATDRLEHPATNREAVTDGIAGDLAALEVLISPTVASIMSAEGLARQGALEILPAPAQILILVLGPNRTLPVRITEFSVTEEAFDQRLNPILARVRLGLRALSSDDLAFGSKGIGLFLTAQRRRERLAAGRRSDLATFGLTGI